MKKVIAVCVAVTLLCGCTINLGTAYTTSATQTPSDLELGKVSCKQDAELAWSGSFGRQAGAFFLGFIIVGLPVAIAWERTVKRSTWQECMKARGFRVEQP